MVTRTHTHINTGIGQCESSKIQFAALHFLLLFYYKDRLCAVAISIKFIPNVYSLLIIFFNHTFIILAHTYICFLFNNNNNNNIIWAPHMGALIIRTPFLLCSFSIPLPHPIVYHSESVTNNTRLRSNNLRAKVLAST